MSFVVDDVMVEEALVEGAYNAVNVCLRVKPNEKVTIITDERTNDIAAALCSEVNKIGAHCNKFLLEDFAPRPHINMPQPILDDLASSNVTPVFLPDRRSMMAIPPSHNERQFRKTPGF